MADTIKTRSELETSFADNTTGNITAQNIRDFVKSVNVLEEKNVADGYAGLDGNGKIVDSLLSNAVITTSNLATNVSGIALTSAPTVNGSAVLTVATTPTTIGGSNIITAATLPANMSGATLTSVPNVNGSPMLTTATGLRYLGGNTAGTLTVASITPSNFDYTVCVSTQIAGSRSSKILMGYAPDWTTLTQIDIRNNGLTYLPDITGIRNLINVDLRDNAANSTAQNLLLSRLVINGATNGTLNIAGQTGNAAPTGQGLTDVATLESRGWTITKGALLAGARGGFIGCSFTYQMADGSSNSGKYAFPIQLLSMSDGVLGGWKMYAMQGYGSAEILATYIPAAVADAANVDFYVFDTGIFNNINAVALHPLSVSAIKANITSGITALLATGKCVIVLEPYPSAAIWYNTAQIKANFIELRDWVKALNGTQPGLFSTQTVASALASGSGDECFYNLTNAYDGVHPNEYGNSLIANRMWNDLIKPIMRTSAQFTIPSGAESVRNSTFTGTGGTVGLRTTGTSAQNWDFAGNGSSSSAAVISGTGSGLSFSTTNASISGTPGGASYPTFADSFAGIYSNPNQITTTSFFSPGDTIAFSIEVDNFYGFGKITPNFNFYDSGGTIIVPSLVKLEANPTSYATDWRTTLHTQTGNTATKQKITGFYTVPPGGAKMLLVFSIYGNVSGVIKSISVKKL